MNQPWIYMCSPARSPLPPPSPSHPSGSSQCTSPEHLSHASNLGWWSVSPLIIYMFHAVLSDHPTLPFQLWVGSVKWWKLEEKTAHSTITRQVFSQLRIIHSPWPPLWVPSSLQLWMEWEKTPAECGCLSGFYWNYRILFMSGAQICKVRKADPCLVYLTFKTIKHNLEF